MSPSQAINFPERKHGEEASQHNITEFQILLQKPKNYPLLWYSKTICFKLSKGCVKMPNKSAEINRVLRSESPYHL